MSGAVLGMSETGGTNTSAPATSLTDHTVHEGQTTPGAVTSAPAAKAAVWSLGGRGNYWSDYRGYDADGDGIGDRPYLPDPPLAGAMEDNPNLRFFQFTLAQQAIDAAGDMFPVYNYDPVIEDAGPLTSPPGPALPQERGVNANLLVVSGLLVLLVAIILQFSFDFDPIGYALNRGRRIAGLLNRGAA
jgi:hypothetical protein